MNLEKTYAGQYQTQAFKDELGAKFNAIIRQINTYHEYKHRIDNNARGISKQSEIKLDVSKKASVILSRQLEFNFT